MKLVWLGALALASLIFGSIAVFGSAPQAPSQLQGADVVFIGSSLTRAAIPPAGNLFGDGRRHVRLSIRGGMSEQRGTEVLAWAVEASVPHVYVEAQPYLRTMKKNVERYANVTDRGPTWMAGFTGSLNRAVDVVKPVRRTALRILGIDERLPWRFLDTDDERIGRTYNGNTKGFETRYPLLVHQPRRPLALHEVLSEARRRNIQVTFLMYPQSQTLADYLGPNFVDQMTSAIDTFQREFGVELWAPAMSWPDEFFRDRGHMNLKGRERYLALFGEHFGRQ
jgi:hypothetical protein